MAGPLEVAALLHTGLIDQTAMAVRVFSARPYARSTFSHCDSRTLAAYAPADKGGWDGRPPGMISYRTGRSADLVRLSELELYGLDSNSNRTSSACR